MLYEITLKSRLLFDVVYHVENAINTPDVTAVRFLNSRKEHLSTWDVSLLREQRDENDPLKGARGIAFEGVAWRSRAGSRLCQESVPSWRQ